MIQAIEHSSYSTKKSLNTAHDQYSKLLYSLFLNKEGSKQSIQRFQLLCYTWRRAIQSFIWEMFLTRAKPTVQRKSFYPRRIPKCFRFHWSFHYNFHCIEVLSRVPVKWVTIISLKKCFPCFLTWWLFEASHTLLCT